MGKLLSATIYKSDGTVIEESYDKEPDYKVLQRIVGGYIERVSCLKNGRECDMIINEEGLYLGLDKNKQATQFFTEWLDKTKRMSLTDVICGDVIVFNNFDLS